MYFWVCGYGLPPPLPTHTHTHTSLSFHSLSLSQQTAVLADQGPSVVVHPLPLSSGDPARGKNLRPCDGYRNDQEMRMRVEVERREGGGRRKGRGEQRRKRRRMLPGRCPTLPQPQRWKK